MKNNKIFLFLILGMIWAGEANAQNSWSLEQCIHQAMAHNLSAKKFAIQTSLAKEEYKQSKLDQLPTLSGSISAGMNYGRSIDPTTNGIVNNEFLNNSYTLNASFDLFKGFLQRNQIQYQKFMLKSKESAERNNSDLLAFSVMTDFYNVIYYQGMIRIAEEQIALSELTLKRTESMANVGLKAKADLLEMKANREKEILNKIQMENKMESFLLSLKQKMNLPAEDTLNLEEPILAQSVALFQPTDADELYKEYAPTAPALNSAKALVNAGRKYLAIARSQYYPQLYASGSYNTGYFETNKDDQGKIISFKTQMENNKNKYFGLSLQIPILSRGSARSGVRKAKLNLKSSQVELEQAEQELYFQLKNNTNELAALAREVEQTRKQYEFDALAYEAAEKKYQQGLINVVELNTVKNRLASTNSSALQARLQWEIKKKTHDFYLGERFWESDTSYISSTENNL